MNTELMILRSLLRNENYTKSVLPFLKPDYFQQEDDRVLFTTIKDFIVKYNKAPTTDVVLNEIDGKKGVRDEVFKAIKSKIAEIEAHDSDPNEEWMRLKTESFCRDKAIYNAIMQSISIIQKDNVKNGLSEGAIPGLLSDAIGLSFDPNVGHDFLEQSDNRFDYYHRQEERIPFDLKFFNLITRNGLPKKTLTVAMAGPNVGKSLWMTHNAAYFLSLGKHVLYITMEMREEEIAKRIDVNQMNITFDDLDALSKDMFTKRIANLRKKTSGKLIIKEYPNGTASTTHFKALLNELAMKKDFTPDVIFIDYMNICASARLDRAKAAKHEYVQSIAEEFRALASEYDLPVVTATQVNREGFRSSEVGMENIAESFGVTGTADLIFYMQTSEELEQLGQLLITQLKNRLNAKNTNRRFVIGVDYNKMKLYDTEDSAQNDIDRSGQLESEIPVFDKTNFSSNNTDRFKILKVT